MAIQSRRGAYNDFDPQKLVPGEWAVVLSGDPNSSRGRAVYMAFEAGNIERMATYEDMEENVEAAVTDVQEQFTSELTAKISAADTATQNAVTATQNAQYAATAAQNAADAAQAIIDAGDAVTSWNGRAGTVVPVAGDYDATQVTYKNTTVHNAIDSNYSLITGLQNNLATAQTNITSLQTSLTNLFAYQEVTVNVTYAAGTIGTRGATVSIGTTVKSGYKYLGAMVIEHQNSSTFACYTGVNPATNSGYLACYRASTGAASDLSVKVCKLWIKV